MHTANEVLDLSWSLNLPEVGSENFFIQERARVRAAIWRAFVSCVFEGFPVGEPGCVVLCTLLVMFCSTFAGRAGFCSWDKWMCWWGWSWEGEGSAWPVVEIMGPLHFFFLGLFLPEQRVPPVWVGEWWDSILKYITNECAWCKELKLIEFLLHWQCLTSSLQHSGGIGSLGSRSTMSCVEIYCYRSCSQINNRHIKLYQCWIGGAYAGNKKAIYKLN
jgi:hypothetical protein